MKILFIILVLLFLLFPVESFSQDLYYHSSDSDEIRVVLLGTGYPRPQFDQFGPSTLVEIGDEKFLFDCGRGAEIRLSQIGREYTCITKLFLTHLHSDHTVGIPDVWLTGWINCPRTKPLQVWGPAGTSNMMEHLQKAYEYDIHMRRDIDEKLNPEGVIIIAREISEGIVFESGDITVTAFEVEHGPVKPAYGFRIDYRDFSVALSGDTRPTGNLIKYCKGVDLIIHEAVSPEWFRKHAPYLSEEQIQAVLDHHTTPEQAGLIFKSIFPRLAVYSHIENEQSSKSELVTSTRKIYSGPFIVGEDLMAIEIGEKINVLLDGEIILTVE
jgi:ribonuclease Z